MIWHWMMSPGWVCWRRTETALYAVMRASRALILQGRLVVDWQLEGVYLEYVSHPFPWTSSGVCLFAKVLGFHASVSRRPYQRSIRSYARMRHHRDIHIVVRKCSSIEEANLAATSLCTE